MHNSISIVAFSCKQKKNNMAALRELRPPDPRDEEEEEDTTWDSTFQREVYRQAPAGSATISSHAMAVGSRVYGIARSNNNNNDADGRDIDDDSPWTWEQSLTGEDTVGLINTLSSNSDGTVVVAATDAGVVALMRGSDGEILATRRVCSDDSGASLINLTWIPNSQGDDVLLIEAPNNSNDDDGDDDGASKLILVSNIQGENLNHPNLSVVAEAAQKMLIQTISFHGCGYQDAADLRAISGCFTTPNNIRLIACDSEGKFVVFDYTLTEKNLTFVQTVLLETPVEGGGDFMIDFDVGLHVQMKEDKAFFLCSAVTKESTFLFWFDPISLRTACQFALPRTSNDNRTKVMAIENVQSFSGSDALAVVVAEKNVSPESSAASVFYVVQVLVEETLGLTVLTKPHVLYNIPTEEGTISVALASVPSSTPYSFRYKLWKKGAKDCMCRQFEPVQTVSSALGRIRSLACRGHFDQADELLAQVGVDVLEKEVYADFYPSEIALHRLKHSLTKGSDEGADALEQAQICLRRLAAGAVSSNEKGLPIFLESVNVVIKSPSNLSLDSFLFGLKALVSTIATVISTSHSEKLQSKKYELEKRICALEFLLKAQACEATGKFQLTTPFKSIRSPSHLYGVLVKEHKFELAETLYRSNLRNRLSVESLVMPLLELSSDVQPQEYVSLISQVAVPNLVINDELFLRLKSWCCKVADDLDDKNEENLNLEAAILLLETVEKGNRELQLKIHSSFGSFTPFSEHVDAVHHRRSPRNQSNLSGGSFDLSSSRDSIALPGTAESQTSKEKSAIGSGSRLPVPTILEVAVPKRRRFVNEEPNAENEDCVKDKLAAAKCLREARSLGLQRSVSLLRYYEENEGAQFIAKKMIKLLSAGSESHGARMKVFSVVLRPFCQQFGISEDTAKFECTVDLCRGKSVSSKAIEESCSIARSCSSVIVRCDVALAVLRAALLCDSALGDVLKLAKEAIVWASCDSGRQSELEEAARLLKIDSIVLKYCGSGARELFRVENPRHALRLLAFVTKHVERETVIDDALSLCDAFHHLASQDAVSTILQNAILHDDSDLLVVLFKKLVEKDGLLASKGLVGSILVSEEILEECAKARRSGCDFDRLEQYRNRAKRVSTRCGELVLCAMENGLVIPRSIRAEIDCYVQVFSLKSLRNAFLRIERLQTEYDVYISLTELRQTKVSLDRTSQFLEEVAACHTTGDSERLNKKLTTAKRACSLLAAGSDLVERDLWIAASAGVAKAIMSDCKDGKILDFLTVIGLLVTNNNNDNDLAGRAHLSIALSLCVAAANRIRDQCSLESMKMVVEATSLVRDWSLVTSKDVVLASTMALAAHLSIATQVFSRGDEGTGESIDYFRNVLRSKAWARMYFDGVKPPETTASNFTVPVHRPTLHPTWYVGDGLLLPPVESISKCLLFCRSLLAAGISTEDGSVSLSELVGGRGAHSLALRVLCTTGAIQASCGKRCDDRSAFHDLQIMFADTTQSLAERSLGGTGSGITSSVIDSQQAVTFLLALPMKQAFAAYRSCLPTTVKTQNFDRLFTLASVGIVAGSGVSKLAAGAMFSVGWKRQPKFLEQCLQLSAKAKWWSILKGLGVEFDSQRFQDSEVSTSGNEGDSSGQKSKYAATLIPKIIARMSLSRSAAAVLCQTFSYAKTFCLPRDLVVSRHVEFLLKPSATPGHSNRSFDPTKREKTVRTSLQLLHPPLKRASVLRRCLVELEKSKEAGQDYELFNLVLALYQETLYHVVDRDTTVGQLNLAPFEAELELIDRRRDALAVLSSFFVGERLAERPSFPTFFLPLRVPFDHSVISVNEMSLCGVLGNDSSDNHNLFDPLKPLETVFLTSLDTSAVTALAPLCHPLGLPRGYIHARSLKARFHHSRKNSVAQPSFENDVSPVLKRIHSPNERAVLAEWCADQYGPHNDTEKLKCFAVVLQSCMQASTEIEQKRRHFPKDDLLEQQELLALETVKRMNSIQDSLSDTLRAKAILLAADGQSKGAVKQISDVLVQKLDFQCQEESQGMCPESLIDFLYDSGSLLASRACLEDEKCLSISQFRQFCSIVHCACQSIAEQHSHIDHGYRARRFAHRWLFFGDEGGTSRLPEAETSTAVEPASSTALVDIDEEDTLDFVMDLSGIQAAADNDWFSGEGGKTPTKRDSKTSCEEESSALRDVSSRELSEKIGRRAALRIAFVMAFSADQRSPSVETGSKENADSNRSGTKRHLRLTKLQSKIDSKQETVQDQCLELLQIVFAKSGTSSSILFSGWSSLDSTDTSMSINKKEAPKTITFAMRHRALRAASILCPQEVLEKVASDEDFLRSNNGETCSLLQSTFGAFLAKEIEEMGLPLPHSDLVQLSSMNFVSYARALWRHHRDDDVLNRSKGKGRLLLLLTEMSCKSSNKDSKFIAQLLDEMMRLNLSRSLLLALEHIVVSGTQSSFGQQMPWEALSKAIAAAGRAVLLETRRLLSNEAVYCAEKDLDVRTISETFERLYKIAVDFCDTNPEQGLQQLWNFAALVKATCEIAPEHPVAIEVSQITKLACEQATKYSKLPAITVTLA